MLIERISSNSISSNLGKESETLANINSESSFRSFLEKSINEVNDLLVNSDQKSTEVVTGKAENLHEASIAVEKAETAFKLLVQVRNKVLDAYQEIIRMQV